MKWSQWPGLNRRPTVYETVALPLSYIGIRTKAGIRPSSVSLASTFQHALRTEPRTRSKMDCAGEDKIRRAGQPNVGESPLLLRETHFQHIPPLHLDLDSRFEAM